MQKHLSGKPLTFKIRGDSPTIIPYYLFSKARVVLKQNNFTNALAFKMD